MKKRLALACVFIVMALSFSACKSNNADGSKDEISIESAAEKESSVETEKMESTEEAEQETEALIPEGAETAETMEIVSETEIELEEDLVDVID